MIDKVRKDHIIMKCNHKRNVVIMFSLVRSDYLHISILNVKILNTFVRYDHLKMDILSSCLQLVEAGCYYMTSIYLKCLGGKSHRTLSV